MRIKPWLVTGLIGLFLIGAGALGFSGLYRVLFDPEKIAEGSEILTPAIGEEEERYRREIFYPFFSEQKEIRLTDEGQKQTLLDLCGIHPHVYEPVLALASLTAEDLGSAAIREYEYPEGTLPFVSYHLREMFYLSWERDGERKEALFLIDEEGMPVYLLWGDEVCERAVSFSGGPAESGGGGTIRSRTAVFEELSSETALYLSGLDAALDAMPRYHSLIREMGEQERAAQDSEGDLTERGPGSLEEYGRQGEWEIYEWFEQAQGTREAEEDAGLTAYVCLVDDLNLVVYYDGENDRFCGYNLALNGFSTDILSTY